LSLASPQPAKNMRRICLTVLLLVVSGCATPPTSPPPSPPTLGAYPGGAINAAVTQDNIKETICVTGWTATVRPATSHMNAIKLKLLRAQGLADADKAKYELDHYIPLELGGHPSRADNLWLQPWDGDMGARAKDRLENQLKKMVCAGEVTLEHKRAQISRPTGKPHSGDTWRGSSQLRLPHLTLCSWFRCI